MSTFTFGYPITASPVYAFDPSPVPGQAGHYHVLAAQDLGGSHEWLRGWEEPLSLADAKQLVADMIRADRVAHWSRTHAEAEAALGKLRSEFGDRYQELVSTNVNPGWEAIWITYCSHDNCVADLVFGGGDWREWEPYWTSATENREGEALDGQPCEHGGVFLAKRSTATPRNKNRAALKPLRDFLQLDGWANYPAGDSVMVPDGDGDVLMGGFRREPQRSGTTVRIHVAADAEREDVLRVLRKQIEIYERGDFERALLDDEPPF